MINLSELLCITIKNSPNLYKTYCKIIIPLSIRNIQNKCYKSTIAIPKLQAISIGLKPADAIPLTDAQKRTGDGFRQEFGSPALPFAQKRLYLRPQHLNRIHIGAVRRQIPQLYACGVICVVCPRRSAAAFCPALCSILPIFLISLRHIVPPFAAIVKGDCYFGSCYNYIDQYRS